jgi:hypothetical protein
MRTNFTRPPSKRNRRAPETDVAIVTEAVKIVKSRGSFNQAAFLQYLDTAGWFVALPDEITPEWTHSVAEHLADEFALWQAGGLQ